MARSTNGLIEEEIMMDDRIPVGVLGATGAVGQKLVELLIGHRWFRLAEACGSPSSSGQELARGSDAGEEGASQQQESLRLKDPASPWESPILLSALPTSAAREQEVRLAEAGHVVVSNASTHRMRPDVPLIVPEVNPQHLELVTGQAWDGALVTNPNCAVAGLTLALAPLHDAFGVERIVVTSFQAISGAGTPGPPASSLLDNVLPLIPGEEEKFTGEPQKILGLLDDGVLAPAEFPVSASCTRVSVSHGHLLSISAALSGSPSPEMVTAAMEEYRGSEVSRGLPSVPKKPLEVMLGADRPQPRLDRDRGKGMTVTVGRIRTCEVLDVKFFALAHNLVRGAAGAALLNAELCHAEGLLARR